MVASQAWQLLIVEDDVDIARQLRDDAKSGKLIGSVQEKIKPTICRNFNRALRLIEERRFDITILDLRDDAGDNESDNASAGLELYAEIQKLRFMPIVFYTGLPEYVTKLSSPFVRIVEKAEGLKKVRAELDFVFKTGLPALSRYLEQTQRKYMWDFLEDELYAESTNTEEHDIAFLLARQLANSLSGDSVRRFLSTRPGYVNPSAPHCIHPAEMYIYPPVNSKYLAGDMLLEKTANGTPDIFWVIITPSCDFEQNKVDYAILAKCFQLEEQQEYIKFQSQIARGDTPSNTTKKGLLSLLKDNRSQKQPERYKFLPSAFTLPNLVVDFQVIKSLKRESLETMKHVASLDSPFAESLIARFTRYYGRFGTPDLDCESLINRLSVPLEDIEESNRDA